jgi:Listeria/Bacterioides repeat
MNVQKLRRLGRIGGAALAVVLASILGACQNPSAASTATASLDGSKKVTIKLYSATSKTISPTTPTIASYELLGGTAGSTQASLGTWTDLGSASVTLMTGSYDFTLDAYDSSSNLVLEGTLSSQAISADGSLAFTLSPISSGTGSVSVTVTWPSSVSVDHVTASYAGGDATTLTITTDSSSSTGSVTYSAASTASGNYPIVFKLYDSSSKLLSSVTEVAKVRKNLSTTGTVALSASDFDPSYTVTYDSNVPTGLSLASGTAPSDSTSYSDGATVTILGNTGSLAISGYTFTGWNTAANGSGTAYAASGDATLTIASTNVTLYAQWSPISWTQYSTSLGMYVVASTYANAQFITVNSVSSALSSDGITWTKGTNWGNKDWYGIAYGDNVYVAVGELYTGAYVSTDGLTWTPHAVAGMTYADSVVYGSANNRFVMVAHNTNNSAAYSDDAGATWTTFTMPGSSCIRLAYGGGTYVAITYAGTAAAYSLDGITWTATTMPSNSAWSQVAYGNGMFVAVAGGNAAYSSDGITWTAFTLPGAEKSITYGNGIFMAISYDGSTAYSIDGKNWYTGATAPSPGSGSYANYETIAYGNGRYVAVSEDGNYSVVGQ